MLYSIFRLRLLPKGKILEVPIYNLDKYFSEAQRAIKQTADLIDLYVKLFGPYPFRKEKYCQSLTELAGGMEHQTMTTLGNFGFDLVALELEHMWFGDNVTRADWSDIWVNEGFATYADCLANNPRHILVVDLNGRKVFETTTTAKSILLSLGFVMK